jgi:hypothetical protein
MDMVGVEHGKPSLLAGMALRFFLLRGCAANEAGGFGSNRRSGVGQAAV